MAGVSDVLHSAHATYPALFIAITPAKLTPKHLLSTYVNRLYFYSSRPRLQTSRKRLEFSSRILRESVQRNMCNLLLSPSNRAGSSIRHAYRLRNQPSSTPPYGQPVIFSVSASAGYEARRDGGEAGG